MEITATVRNTAGMHEALVRTGTTTQPLAIAAKATGRGSAVNGGELLMLALATCYCNDLYREADRLGIAIDGVEVEASAEFAGVGLAARNIRYRATVSSAASADTIATLLRETDAVAEIHNTIRAGVPVTLEPALERRRPRPPASH
jgi:organic hydroperoxide reductase OsmC/OhrA